MKQIQSQQSLGERVVYVTRLVQRHEIPRMAEIQHDAFNDPNNTTADEVSIILAIDEHIEAGRQLTRKERVANLMERQQEYFDQSKYTVVGVYLQPSCSPFPSDQREQDVETLDQESIKLLSRECTLVGFSIWQNITSTSPAESPQTDAKEVSNPTFSNRFFAKMNRTRESTMKGKSYWFLKLLTIHPNHQRRGIGSTLVKWGTTKANQQGIQAWLESSPMGIPTYLKAGFKILGIDTIKEPRAKRGFVEWPYMIYESNDINKNNNDNQQQQQQQQQQQ
ncbi:uncharacterized protein MEPE_04102 [Melanopsichium pennsylvanicum]|uniref:N-acetyltransferase domain-containing protein n=1 Tax=Melanopsichium pennsylvanicum TaxID=63383 RepID=A0AAJ5C6C3_9BASI|nr:uncharacterized protein MEPE_04102 [Melanopsichium pennsylvanicum]